MEFRMNAEVFKNKVERAIVVSRKTKDASYQRHIRIVADKENGRVNISTANLGTYVTLMCGPGECEVVESGEIYLDIETVKRLFNAYGSCQYFSNDGYSFTVKNRKKSSKVLTVSDVWPEFPNTDDRIHMADIDKADFIDTMEKMQNFTAFDAAKPVYCGFNLDAGRAV